MKKINAPLTTDERVAIKDEVKFMTRLAFGVVHALAGTATVAAAITMAGVQLPGPQEQLLFATTAYTFASGIMRFVDADEPWVVRTLRVMARVVLAVLVAFGVFTVVNLFRFGFLGAVGAYAGAAGLYVAVVQAAIGKSKAMKSE